MGGATAGVREKARRPPIPTEEAAGRTVPVHEMVETLTNTDLTTEEEFPKEQTMSLLF
jgi:hypothetical protein